MRILPRRPFVRNQCIGLLGSLLVLPAIAQVSGELSDTELQRQQQREEARRRQDEVTPDVHLSSPKLPGSAAYPTGEKPCFVIRHVKLEGEQAARFAWALSASSSALGRCLGSTGINTLVANIQNALIELGFVTTRVLAAPQDLQSGELNLLLAPGSIRAIRFADGAQGGYNNALPVRRGDILNLRAIEQGLENFKRVPGTEADIQIVPGESDLVIKWDAGRRYRINLSAG